MAGRVTLQDIADELGVSRNTVSKAINNTGILAKDTREKVLQKAIEMGYKQFSYIKEAAMNETAGQTKEPQVPAGGMGEIALLTRGFPGNSRYISVMLNRLQGAFSRKGYAFTMHWIHEEDEEGLRLPLSFDKGKTTGIVCVEMLDYQYCSMLCSLDIPVLFVDSPVMGMSRPLKADFIYPDNQSAVCGFVREMVRRGKKQIGFLGEYMHCQSFFERYMGYRNAMYLCGLPCPEEKCVLGNQEGVKRPAAEEYQAYLKASFLKMKELPEVYLCANDYVAFDAMRVLKGLGVAVPQDVWLCGFDDTVEAKVSTPSLTTACIHSHVMGDSAAYLLASRIKEPSLDCRAMHVQTGLIYRESTAD